MRERAPGDTLQAVRGHAFAPVLADPGEQDLTAHVDFEALAQGRARRRRRGHRGRRPRANGSSGSASARAPPRSPRANPERAEEHRRRASSGCTGRDADGAACSRSWRSMRPTGRRRRGSHDRQLSRRRRRATPPRSSQLFRDELLATRSAISTRRGPRRLPARLTAPSSWSEQLADPPSRSAWPRTDGALVGYVKLGPMSCRSRPTAPAIELHQLYVAEAWQGAGVAGELMDWALAEARAARRRRALSVACSSTITARGASTSATASSRSGRYAFMVGNHADEDIIMRLDAVSESR